MTAAKTLPFSKFLLLLGDGADPEVFAQPCALNTRGIKQSATTQDTSSPDCTDEDAPVWVQKMIDLLSASVSAAGKLSLADLPTFQTWFSTGTPKNVRMKVDDVLANNGGYWAFAAVLTEVDVTAQSKQLAEISLSIEASGEVVWVPAAA